MATNAARMRSRAALAYWYSLRTRDAVGERFGGDEQGEFVMEGRRSMFNPPRGNASQETVSVSSCTSGRVQPLREAASPSFAAQRARSSVADPIDGYAGSISHQLRASSTSEPAA